METREELLSRKADLQRQRGFAGMHGKPTEALSKDIAAIDAALGTMDDMEAAKMEAVTAEALQQQKAETLAAQSRLCALVNAQLSDVQEAQEAARVLAAAFSRMLNRIPDMGRTHRDFTHTSPPVCLNELEL